MDYSTIFIIVGNILSFLSYIFGFLYINCKTKDDLLKVDLFTSTLSLLSVCFLMSLSGVLNTLVTLVRLQVIRYKDNHNKNLYSLFVLFLLLYASIFLDFRGLETICLFISSMFSFIPKWFSKNPQVIRFTGACASLTIIYWQFSIKNYAGVLCQLYSIVTIFIGLYKNKKRAS